MHMFELMIIACVDTKRLIWKWWGKKFFFVKKVKIVLFDLKYTNVVTVTSKTG